MLNIGLVFMFLISGLGQGAFALYQEENFSTKAVCDDYIGREIIVKVKTAAPQIRNSFDNLSVQSYLENNITGLGDITITKAIQSPAHGKSIQKTKLQLKAESLQQKYGFDRIYKLSTGEKDCNHVNALIKHLSADPNIEYAEPNKKIEIQTLVNDPLYLSTGKVWTLPYDELWGLKHIGTDQAWDTSTGRDTVVAVLDTGVDYNHPDIWDNIWVNSNVVTDKNHDGAINLDDADLNGDKYISSNEIIPGMFGYDFGNNDNDPKDSYGHGTHVAGTIAAVGNNEKGIIGIAPDAKILMVKGFPDRSGAGSDDALASAVKYVADVLANNPNINSIVSNNSWSGAGHSQIFTDAFDYAKELGVINVVAAGNNRGDARDYYPANLPSVITVAASRTDSLLAGFSNYGPRVDVAAPGGGGAFVGDLYNILSLTNVTSSLATNFPAQIIQHDNERPEYAYLRLAGTSMACPHIVGVAALLKSIHPNYNLEDIRAILRNKIDSVRPNSIQTGTINALSAVTADHIPPQAFLYPASLEPLRGYINLKGTANAVNFQNYTLEYATDLNSGKNPWTLIGTFNQAVEDDLVLSSFDSSVLPEGHMTVRVTVHDSSGEEAKNLTDLNIDNIQLISPRSEDDMDTYGIGLGNVSLLKYQRSTVGNKLMPVIVDAFGPSSPVIDIVDPSISSSVIIDGLINYTGLTTGIIANIDTTKLPHGGLYKLEIIKNKIVVDGTDFTYEPKLTNPNPLRILEQPYSLLQKHFRINDFNNDGIDDILLGQNGVKVFNNSSTTLEHSFSNGFEALESPIAVDLDGDKNKELVCHLYNHSVHKISVLNKFGVEQTQWERYLHESFFETMIGDVNADGRSDILTLTGAHSVGDDAKALDVYLTNFFLGADNLVHQESHLLIEDRITLIDSVIGDFDANKKDEIAILVANDATPSNHTIMIFSLSGELIRTISTNVDGLDSGLVAADIDQDEDLELIVSGLTKNELQSTFTVNALNHDGSMVPGWPFVAEQANWLDISNVVIGDLNNDGYPEIVFGASKKTTGIDNYLFALQQDALSLPKYPVKRSLELSHLTNQTNSAPSSIVIADVDNDGRADIISAMDPDRNSREVIFAYKDDGTLASGFPLHAGNTTLHVQETEPPNSMAIGNFDNDPVLELVFVDALKYIYLYDINVAATAKVEWSMLRSDIKNSGVYYKKGKPRPKADLSIQSSVDKQTVVSGDIITMNLKVRNNLNLSKIWTATAYGVMTSMDIPRDFTPVNIDNQCSIANNRLLCNFQTIAPNVTKSVNVQFKAINSQLKDLETSIGVVSVRATSKKLSEISIDPNSANDTSDKLTILIKQRTADLSIDSFTANQSSYLKGDSVLLTATVNSKMGFANSTAYGVVLKVPQPDFLVFDVTKQDPNQNCSLQNNEIVCQLFNLSPGAIVGTKRTLRFSIPLNSTVGTRSLVIGPATVMAASTISDQITIDPDTGNNSKSTIVNTVQYADLVADIKPSKAKYKYNENISLTLSVQNKRDDTKSYTSTAYNVVTKMNIPTSYEYVANVPDCIIDLNRVLTCNFSSLVSAEIKARSITLKPLATKSGMQSIRFNVNVSAQSAIATQKTIDPIAGNDSKTLDVKLE